MDLLSIEVEPRIGCAVYPAHGLDAAKLIRNALVAMESSHHAADQIGYYDNELDIYNESRLTLLSDLRNFIDFSLEFSFGNLVSPNFGPKVLRYGLPELIGGVSAFFFS